MMNASIVGEETPGGYERAVMAVQYSAGASLKGLRDGGAAQKRQGPASPALAWQVEPA